MRVRRAGGRRRMLGVFHRCCSCCRCRVGRGGPPKRWRKGYDCVAGRLALRSESEHACEIGDLIFATRCCRRRRGWQGQVG